MFNILNGGKHAQDSTDFQEFMVMPVGAATFAEALRAGAEIFAALRTILHDEGPRPARATRAASRRRCRRTRPPSRSSCGRSRRPATGRARTSRSRSTPRPARSSSRAPASRASPASYRLEREGGRSTRASWSTCGPTGSTRYPIVSLEDGLAEDDWAGWRALNARLGEKVQLVGDDILVTNPTFIARGIAEDAMNSVLIKLNQIGTLSETIDAIELARSAGWTAMVSHRSGETEDTTIADFVGRDGDRPDQDRRAVALRAGRQVQPAAAHRGRARRRRPLSGPECAVGRVDHGRARRVRARVASRGS